MSEVIAYGGIFISLTFTLLCLLWGILEIFTRIREVYLNTQWEQHRGSFLISLNQMERWCSYEFPMLDDVCKYLRSNCIDGTIGDISRFRDELRAKQKELEKKEVAP